MLGTLINDGRTDEWVDSREQCDQMARLFKQYFARYNKKLLPNSIKKLPKVGSQIC